MLVLYPKTLLLILSAVNEWNVLAGGTDLEPAELTLNSQLMELCLFVSILSAPTSPYVIRDKIWGKVPGRLSC